MNRRTFLSRAFAASVLPLNAQAAGHSGLSNLREYDTNQPFQSDRPSLVALFMTAQQMYTSCGELFLYANAEIDEIRGGNRNIDKVMIMPPREYQLHSSEDRNIGSARASGFTILTADIQTTLDVSRQIAGRRVFAYEGGKIAGHSQKAFFHNVADGRGFEFDPTENPFTNELYAGLQNI